MKLTIYMKSGHKLLIENVKNYEIKYNDVQITGLGVEYTKEPKNKVLVGSIDLIQIEAVEEHN